MGRASILIAVFLGTANCLSSSGTNSIPELALFGLGSRQITISPCQIGLLKSTTAQLSASLTGYGAFGDTSFSWSSSNNSVVTVSSSGLLSGVDNGLATISVWESGGAMATCRVRVYSGFIYTTLVGNIAVGRATINTLTGLAAANGTIPAGTTPTGIAVDPFGRFAYAGNFGSDSISMYTINAGTGALAANGTLSAGAGSQPRNISITPDGKFLYLASQGFSTHLLYSIDQSSGTLTFINSFNSIGQSAIDLDGKFLIANPSGTSIGSYLIDANTGSLALAGSFAFGSIGPLSMHPGGRFIYMSTGDSVTAFSMDRLTGGLSFIGTVSLATGSGPNGNAVSPDGAFLYTANLGDGTVSTLAINQSDGSLTLASTTAVIGGNNLYVRVDPTSRYVYVSDGAGLFHEFSVDQTTGTLTNIGNLNVGGNQWNLTIL